MNNYLQTNNALGGNVTLVLVSQLEINEIDIIFKDIWNKINEFENRFSRFKNKSELSSVNRNAGTKQSVSNEFIHLLEKAIEYGNLSDGLFNPLILPALQRAGYTKSFLDNHEAVLDDYSDKTVSSSNLIKISDRTILIPFGTAIDFGGIGKGYLADQISSYLDTLKLDGYWLSFGGDIVANGHDSKNKPWVIDIESADNTNRIIGKVKIPFDKKVSVATSGIIKRKGVHNNKNWHHIIDPRTLNPAITDIETVTICMDSTTSADVFATCCVILGSNRLVEFINKHNILSSLMQINTNNELSFKLSGNLIELKK